MDEARSEHPDIEWAFSSDSTIEPVFVKNLETVQGDERDVILFSITYGPDQSGHVTMNFGPLNRDGGERRLNVAMTRARSEMLVFSTLNPERIDLSRTQARAVADLKHFLEYAERGPAALGAAVHGSIGDYESPFETAVARALRDKGWNVHPQVGVSAYRIDLGIVHPDKPGIYLAGVACDGAMYHSSAFARERDKIRQAVLEGVGWHLFRVWSTDGWTHRTKALGTLHEALTRHLESDRSKREDAARASTVNATDPSPRPDLIDGVAGEIAAKTLPAEAAVDDTTAAAPDVGRPDSYPAADHVNPETSTDEAPLLGTPDPAVELFRENNGPEYIIARLDDEHFVADPDIFYTEEYRPRLSAMIEHIIDIEGPIHQDVLVRRIARHHGFQRAGHQIRDMFADAAKRCRSLSKEDVGLFFWREGTIGNRLAPARYKGRDDEMRKVEYIRKEEILAIGTSLSLGDDPVDLARCIGIARLNKRAR